MLPICIILEGLNGTGKTTVAKILSQKYGIPVVRSFRKAVRHDGENSYLDKLRALGIAVNTFVDDFYTADLLVNVGSGAILDRSVASGVAYGKIQGTVRDWEHGTQLVDAWQEIIKRYHGILLYVHTKADPAERAARVLLRSDGILDYTLQQQNELEYAMMSVYVDIDFPKLMIDTTYYKPEQVSKLISKKIEELLMK